MSSTLATRSQRASHSARAALVTSMLAITACALAACASTVPRTEVIVRIVADPGVAAAMQDVRVVVRAGANRDRMSFVERSNRVYDVAPVLPLEIGIVPIGGDATRVYEVTATARGALPERAAITEARVVSGFVPGRTLVLEVRLEDSCRMRTCSEATCRAGLCIADPYVDPASLPALGDDTGPREDAMSEVDAPLSIDAGVDGGGIGCGPTVPSAEATLVASDGASTDLFGYSVALSSDGLRAIVGAPQDGSPDSGSARVFVRSGATWTEEATLTASPGSGIQDAGFSVALNADGTRALVGAYSDTTVAGAAAGSVRVFLRTGTTWTEEATLVASGGTSNDKFGWSVALSSNGERAVVGMPYDDTTAGVDAGSARVFFRSGATWTEEATLLAVGGGPTEEFGHSVALSADGTRALIGAWADDTSGSARIFLRSGMVWTEEATLVGSVRAASDRFGIAVALSADASRALVGADRDDTAAGADAGSARVFVRTGTNWTGEATLLAADSEAGDEFGFSVALSSDGSRAALGVVWDDTAGGVDAGSARVFTRAGTSWTEEATVLASDGAPGDEFGFSIALTADGTRLLAGVEFDDTAGGPDAGSARLYMLAPPGSGSSGPEGHCYVFAGEASNAAAAATTCDMLGGHLVTITSPSEQLVAVAVSMGATWIGATDEGSEGTWRWTTGEPWATPYWEATQPDNAGGGENCAAIYFPDGTWADVPCGSMYPAVCEID